MTISQIITIAISALGVGGLISGIILRRIDKMSIDMERKLDEQDEARIEESVLIMQGMKAVGHLAEESAFAQKTGRVNGELDEAIRYYVEFKNDLNNYLLKQNAVKNHGRH